MLKLEHRWCPECNEAVVVVDGVTALWGYGNWWCAKHAKVEWENGHPYVEFGSSGMLTEVQS